jgi:hypothetical protein
MSMREAIMSDQAFPSYGRYAAPAARAEMRRVSAAWVWGLAGLLVALLALPLFLVDVVPMNDFPSHLVRVTMLSHLPLDPLLARAWSVDLRPLPNLAIDLFVPLVAPWLGAEVGLKLFMALGLALWVAGAVLIHRGLWRETSPQALFAVFFAANPTFYYGFANFHFGAGLALAACGVWLCARRSAGLIAAMTASALALLFCHLMALAIFALLLGGFEIGRLWAERARPAAVLRALAQGVVIFLPAALLWAFAFEHGHETGVEFKWLNNLLAIFLYSSGAGAISYNVLPALALIATLALAHRAGRLEMAPRAIPVIALMTAAMLCCPAVALSGAVIHVRLPAVVAVLLLASVRLDLTHKQRHAMFAVTLAGAMAAGGGEWMRWRAGAETIAEIRAVALDHIEPGARVVTALARRDDATLAHAVDLTVLDRKAFTPSLFTFKGQSTLVVRDAYRGIAAQDAIEGAIPTLADLAPLLSVNPPAPSRALRPYGEIACAFDYLFVIGAGARDAPPALVALVERADFALYKIAPQRPCAPR